MTFIITDGEDVITVLKERPEFVSEDFALIEVGSHRIARFGRDTVHIMDKEGHVVLTPMFDDQEQAAEYHDLWFPMPAPFQRVIEWLETKPEALIRCAFATDEHSSGVYANDDRACGWCALGRIAFEHNFSVTSETPLRLALAEHYGKDTPWDLVNAIWKVNDATTRNDDDTSAIITAVANLGRAMGPLYA